MNYMDYTYDNCMYMFTNGQATRMLAALNGSRASLLSSQGCAPLLAYDAGVFNIINPSGTSCNSTFTPQVELKNFGSAVLTSVNIHYQLNAGPVNVFVWSGNIASGSSLIINLPAQTVAPGNHTFTSYTSQPNGNADGYTGNDSKTVNFSVISPIGTQVIPFFQGFDASTFPPTGWVLQNSDNNNTWERVTNANGFGNSTACARMDHYSGVVNIAGQSDYLFTPSFNFSSETPPLSLEFSVAYARYSSVYYDSLFVLVSEDCGQTWVRIYAKGNNPALATAPDNTAGFVPAGSQWRKETINIDAYAGKSNVKFAFEAKSGWGNYCYVDDINIYKQQVLPVELISFTGRAENKYVKLNWTTATEINNEKFILEKSNDNFTFYELAQIAGKGNSSVAVSYEYMDQNPFKGINYYKLKQKDWDGKVTTKDVIAVKFNTEKSLIKIYPNPDNTGEISVIYSGQSEVKEIIIYSPDGKKAAGYKSENNNLVQLKHHLDKGIYFVQIVTSLDIFTEKLIIQ